MDHAPLVGVVQPLADVKANAHSLVHGQPAALLQKRLVEQLEGRRSSYLGIHDAEGEPCHHLLFRGERADAQVWITTGDEPLFRKLVLTFRDIEGSPQQSLTFSDWDLKAKIKRDAFKAQLPDGARAIEFLPVGGE